MGRFSCKTAACPRPAAHRRLGSPLQQDMCYWLEGREIRLEKGARALPLPPYFRLFSPRLPLLSSPASLRSILSFIRFLLLFSVSLPPRVRAFSAEHLGMFPSEGQTEPGVIQIHDCWALRAAHNARLRPPASCLFFFFFILATKNPPENVKSRKILQVRPEVVNAGCKQEKLLLFPVAEDASIVCQRG